MTISVSGDSTVTASSSADTALQGIVGSQKGVSNGTTIVLDATLKTEGTAQYVLLNPQDEITLAVQAQYADELAAEGLATKTYTEGEGLITLNADVVLEKVTVTFNTQGGNEIVAQTVYEGAKAAKPADPTKADYVFGGWYTDAACTEAFDFDTVITADTTLYAKWTQEKSEDVPGTDEKPSDTDDKKDTTDDSNKPATENPDTGDSSSLWLLVVLFAAIGVITLTVRGRKATR